MAITRPVFSGFFTEFTLSEAERVRNDIRCLLQLETCVYGWVDEDGGTPRESCLIRNSCSSAAPPPAARPISEFSIVSLKPRSFAG